MRSATSTARVALGPQHGRGARRSASCASARATLTRLPASARSALGSEPSAWRASAIGERSPRCSVLDGGERVEVGRGVERLAAAATASSSASGRASGSGVGAHGVGGPTSVLRARRSAYTPGRRKRYPDVLQRIAVAALHGDFAGAQPGAGVQAHRRRGRQVQALGPAVDRDAHPVVGGRGELRPAGRAPRCRTARRSGRPGRRPRAGRPGPSSPRPSAASRVSPAARQAVEHGAGVAVAGERQVEHAAGGRAHRLAVVRVDRVAGEHHRVGAGGVGDPDDGAGVARVGDPDQHRDQRGRSGERDAERARRAGRRPRRGPAG